MRVRDFGDEAVRAQQLEQAGDPRRALALLDGVRRNRTEKVERDIAVA